MPDAFSAIIYGALLSSRSFPGSCTSSRSVVKVIVGCMRGKSGLHATSDPSVPQHTRKNRVYWATKSGPKSFPFTAGVSLSRHSVLKAPRAGEYCIYFIFCDSQSLLE